MSKFIVSKTNYVRFFEISTQSGHFRKHIERKMYVFQELSIKKDILNAKILYLYTLFLVLPQKRTLSETYRTKNVRFQELSIKKDILNDKILYLYTLFLVLSQKRTLSETYRTKNVRFSINVDKKGYF